MASSSSGTETFATVASTQTSTFALTTTATRTQQAARYIADDLRGLVREAGINLAAALGIPPDESYVTDAEHLAELICNDIEQMLRDRLIIGVHFLLCEKQLDQTTNAFNIKYHVEYKINLPQRSVIDEVLSGFKDRLLLPRTAAARTRFVLLIDWDPTVNREEIKLVERPRYFFDWRPPNDRYDASSLVHYRTGGLDTIIVRTEFAHPGNIP